MPGLGNGVFTPFRPVMMTDDFRDVDRCYSLGCSRDLVKTVSSNFFAGAILTIGCHISLANVPPIIMFGQTMTAAGA